MSDFVYSSARIEAGELSKVMKSSFKNSGMRVSEFHGDWGSLAVAEEMYSGFEIVENDRYLFFVLGGPVLNFRDNGFLARQSSNEAAKSIFERFLKCNIVYHEDLSGPFLVFNIDKIKKKITFVTDLMLFIPVYQCLINDYLFVSSHIDVIASISSRSNCFDFASLVDFVLNDVVTFPFTAYDGIFQSEPATVYDYKFFGNMVRCTEKSTYWWPYEKKIFVNLDHAATVLRQSLQDYVERVTEGMEEVAHFLSGGEDSRVITGMLPARLKRDGFVFLDTKNREGRISSRVAEAYGVNLHIHVRPNTYYVDILEQAASLVGLGHQYSHVHSLGMHAECGLNRYLAVFGGYLSDSLLKGMYTFKIRRISRMHFVPQFFVKGESRTATVRHPCFNRDLLQVVTERRRQHFERVASLRPRTAHEWFTLWPATMRSTIPNIFAARRLFRSYEPFLGCGVIKVSAGVPIEWKLNRRLFNRALKPFLYKSRYIMHGDGFFPYYPWWMNVFLRQGVSWGRKISRRLGLVRGNQGAWTDWKKLVNSEQWFKIYNMHQDQLESIKVCFYDNNVAQFDYRNLSIDQKMNLMQIIVSL